MSSTALDVKALFILFQEEDVECYDNYLKHKKDLPFTVVEDLETTTGCISEIEGGSMFAKSYCLMFNFHPKLEMTPITCLRSSCQNEQELKFITYLRIFTFILIMAI